MISSTRSTSLQLNTHTGRGKGRCIQLNDRYAVSSSHGLQQNIQLDKVCQLYTHGRLEDNNISLRLNCVTSENSGQLEPALIIEYISFIMYVKMMMMAGAIC